MAKTKHPIDREYRFLWYGEARTMKWLFALNHIQTVLKMKVDGVIRIYLCSYYRNDQYYDGWRLFKSEAVVYALQLARKHKVSLTDLT